MLLILCVSGARADVFQAPDPGSGVVPIRGVWEFHTGDDLRWADPAFNDASWQAISPDQSWGSQGFPGYRGYAWYRKQIRVGPGTEPLGVYVPESDGAYEVYWNGHLIGCSGSLPPHATWYTFGENRMFPLPSGAREGVLALRFWLAPLQQTDDPAAGGLHEAPQIGRLPLLQLKLQLASLGREHRYLPALIAAYIMAAGGLLTLVFFVRQRREWLYLWLAILMMANLLEVVQALTDRTTAFAASQLIDNLYSALSDISLWLTLLWIFGLNKNARWSAITKYVISAYSATLVVYSICVWFWRYAGPGMVRTEAIAFSIFTALTFFTIVLLCAGLLHQKSSSLLPLGVATALYGAWDPVLFTSSLIRPEVGYAMQRWGLKIGGYHFPAYALLSWTLILVIGVSVAWRQIEAGRRQAHFEQEIRSAQEVQHVLIPEELPTIPGLSVASVYKPAAEVGGDFFQVIAPDPEDPGQGTLVIVGDVSGKGLKAAMMVSLIVGTLRTAATYTREPAAILRELNKRLLGRTQGGFATCLVLRLDLDGTVTLANAGHLPPFRDGVEWAVPESLPLGLGADVEYGEVRTHLRDSEALTLITDGVLEARNAKGELYGFERVSALMRERPTAERVAETACSFGQEDDITVVSVTREPLHNVLRTAMTDVIAR